MGEGGHHSDKVVWGRGDTTVIRWCGGGGDTTEVRWCGEGSTTQVHVRWCGGGEVR